MDSYRGQFPDHTGGYDPYDLDDGLVEGFETAGPQVEEDDVGHEPPPSPVGQDERRMQVRAYNHWASLLGTQAFPRATDLSFDAMPELAPYAVMLDFTDGIEDPRLTYLGRELAEECGVDQPIERLSDVPSRSLLSRITDHYMQILANEAPIGFEAEFIGQRERTVVYRGILLPFSEDGTTIRQILGVINWKELADQATTDALLAEIDRALAGPTALEQVPDEDVKLPTPMWAETEVDFDHAFGSDPDVLDLASFGDLAFPDLLPDVPACSDIPAPQFGADEPTDLGGWLASAKALADVALVADERSHAALYAAIGRAWDFALAAAEAPEDYAALLAASGLLVQERAPLTPVIKLVFGVDYDKTRLTEYATALAHAQRLGLGRGALADLLSSAPGGLKGVVQTERRLKREAAGKPAPRKTPREGLARKLRKMAPRPLTDFGRDEGEFTILLARRLETGEMAVIGEAGADVALVERVARQVLG